jgi:hypothetical protein
MVAAIDRLDADVHRSDYAPLAQRFDVAGILEELEIAVEP